MWKPSEEGENIIFRPVSGHIIPKKGKRKESGAIIAVLLGSSSDSFYSGDKKQGVATGDRITIPLSYNLEGEDKLGVHTKGLCTLSPLSKYILSESKELRVVFDGKVKGGQGSVKRFTIMAPPGAREAAAKSPQNEGKSAKKK